MPEHQQCSYCQCNKISLFHKAFLPVLVGLLRAFSRIRKRQDKTRQNCLIENKILLFFNGIIFFAFKYGPNMSHRVAVVKQMGKLMNNPRIYSYFCLVRLWESQVDSTISKSLTSFKCSQRKTLLVLAKTTIVTWPFHISLRRWNDQNTYTMHDFCPNLARVIISIHHHQNTSARHRVRPNTVARKTCSRWWWWWWRWCWW